MTCVLRKGYCVFFCILTKVELELDIPQFKFDSLLFNFELSRSHWTLSSLTLALRVEVRSCLITMFFRSGMDFNLCKFLEIVLI